MMNTAQLKQIEKQYVAQTYARQELAVERGRGETCRDPEGRELIDFSAGIGVNSLGFCHPDWVAAVKNQVDRLAHISNLYYTEPMARLAEALCGRTGMRRVFFANSGAEANEGAIKTARKYAADKYGPERCEIITLVNSFHGRTIATLAATGQDKFHKDFGPFPQGFVHAQANNLADLEAKVSGNTAAILVELVQGEGGVIPLEEDFVAGIAALCARQDILLLVDEVQTGVGRTGTFLCCEQYGLKPDVVTLAKGLGGGLPIGAVLFGEKTQDTLGPGDHGTTFGGNPIACAGACAVLDLMDPGFLREVQRKGRLLRAELEGLEGVSGVSGKGLMLGISLVGDKQAADVVAQAAKLGLIALTAHDKVRLLPPLTVTDEELGRGVRLLAQAIAAV